MGSDGNANVRQTPSAVFFSLIISQLAPMSYFAVVSHNPPTIMISVAAGKLIDGLKGRRFMIIPKPAK